MKYSFGKKGSSWSGCLVPIIMILAFLFIGPAITMWLWNALMPDIFGLPVITYWQAFGLEILGHILLGRTVTISRS